MPAQQSGKTGNIFRKVDYRFNMNCIPVSNNGLLLNWKKKYFHKLTIMNILHVISVICNPA